MVIRDNFCLFLHKKACCWWSFELPQHCLVETILMCTPVSFFYEELRKSLSIISKTLLYIQFSGMSFQVLCYKNCFLANPKNTCISAECKGLYAEN